VHADGHPANDGGPFCAAMVMLFDPDRSSGVRSKLVSV
jgi:hypothetical protein